MNQEEDQNNNQSNLNSLIYINNFNYNSISNNIKSGLQNGIADQGFNGIKQNV